MPCKRGGTFFNPQVPLGLDPFIKNRSKQLKAIREISRAPCPSKLQFASNISPETGKEISVGQGVEMPTCQAGGQQRKEL